MSRPNLVFLPVIASAIWYGASACSGCGNDPSATTPPPAPEGGAAGSKHDSGAGNGGIGIDAGLDVGGASGARDSGADADTAIDGATCPPVEPPANLPPGWVETTPHACDCRIYVPSAAEYMPPPIEWEPCPSDGLQNVDCRIMKATSEGKSVQYPAGTIFAQSPGSPPMLAFGRNRVGGDPDFFLRLIAEADGPVHTAFLRAGPYASTCGLIPTGLAEGRYSYDIVRSTPTGRGMLAGIVDSPHPAIVQAMPDNDVASYDVSSEWLLRRPLGAYSVSSWDGLSHEIVYDPSKDPDGLPAHVSRLVGGDVFFNVNAGGLSGTMSWSKTAGVRPLLRWYGNPDKASGNFGTDGKDMVWTYGEGAAPGIYNYQQLSVMTAPYTTDPAEAQSKARRLRSDPMTLTVFGYKVGCGYAAKAVCSDQDGCALMVVRLSDGVAWMPRGKDPMTYGTIAVGTTCEEVFFQDPWGRVGRVRLDSLGPGIPPD